MGLATLNLMDLKTYLNSLVVSWTYLEISLRELSRLRSFMDERPKRLKTRETVRKNRRAG